MNSEELKSSITWWESKRWVFNVIISAAGIFGITKGIISWYTSQNILVIIFWGIGANLFYSSGMLLEFWDWHYLKNRLKLFRIRRILFLAVTIFSAYITASHSLDYFGNPMLWLF